MPVTIPATGTGTATPIVSTDNVTADSSQVQNVQLATVAAGVLTRVASAAPLPVGDRDSLGQSQYNFPAGFVRVTDEPRQLFYDPFDTALDTTNRWNAATSSGGGVAASVATGVMTLGSGTTISGYSHLQSQPSFAPTVPSWLGTSFAISLEFPLTTNASRFWGVGSSPGTPTSAIPITDGYGFEVDTTGTLNAVVFASGTRTVVAALTAPADAAYHRYIIYYRTDRIFWYYDALTTPVATSNFQTPNIQTLPIKFSAVAHTSAPAASRVISCTGLATWDTGKNNTQLSDGTYPWRKATVSAAGALSVTAGTLITALDAAPNVDTGIIAVGSGPGWDRKLNPANLGTAVSSAITNTVDGQDSMSYAIGTTTTGTFTFEVSGDDSTWAAADVFDDVTNIWVGGTNLTPTSGKQFFVRTAGYRQIRIRTVTTLGATVAVKTTGTALKQGPTRANIFGPANLTTGQQNISNTAATLVVARPTRKRVTLLNRQAEAVFIGPATVTAANGLQLDPGAAMTIEATVLIQGITSAATTNSALKVHIVDEYY